MVRLVLSQSVNPTPKPNSGAPYSISNMDVAEFGFVRFRRFATISNNVYSNSNLSTSLDYSNSKMGGACSLSNLGGPYSIPNLSHEYSNPNETRSRFGSEDRGAGFGKGKREKGKDDSIWYAQVEVARVILLSESISGLRCTASAEEGMAGSGREMKSEGWKQ